MNPRDALGDSLHDHMLDAEQRERPVPELIPTETDLVAAGRTVRRLVRQAERQPRGPRRGRKLERLLPELARLVYLERVMALDELERAALTPARLTEMAQVSREDLQVRLGEMRGETGIEVTG